MPQAATYGGGVPFAEAIDYLKRKIPTASAHWDDFSGPAHAHVFTVAGATKVDIAADFHAALTEAIEQGKTVADFRRDFDAIVAKYGWTYYGKRGWRSSLIFDVNMRSARMAGRWKQIWDNREARPYLQYRTAGDQRVRPAHRKWDNWVLPVDHEFWQTHYPPNGWRCRCTVRSYSAAEAKAAGLQVMKKPPPETMIDYYNGSGQLVDRVPHGIDRGWDHNVGQSWLDPALALGEKLAKLPAEIRSDLIERTISPGMIDTLSANWGRFFDRIAVAARTDWTPHIVGFMSADMLQALEGQRLNLIPENLAIGVFDKKVVHLRGDHKSRGLQVWPSDWIQNMPEHLRDYRAIFLDIKNNTLLVIPNRDLPNGTTPKITLDTKFNRKGKAIVSVASLGSTNIGDLKNTQAYRLLAGVI